MTKNKINGFTLVELLVVIAIIAALTAITVPIVGSMIYSSRVTSTVANLKQVGIANELYGQEHQGRVNGLGSAPMPQFGVNQSVGHYWRVAAYLGADNGGGLTQDSVNRACMAIHHPHIPAEITHGPTSRRFSVAVNREFNNWKASRHGQFPSMSKYDAGNTIYAVSGITNIRIQDLDDKSFLELPKEGRRRGPYYTKKKQLPCVYLDGSVKLEKFPIDKSKLDPQYQE